MPRFRTRFFRPDRALPPAGRWAVPLVLVVACALVALAPPARAVLGNGAYVANAVTTSIRAEGGTLTLLLDGRVLLSGEGTAELYDPTIGTWSPTGAPIVHRNHQTATLLASGKVLVTGGWNGAAPEGLATTEIFDPATGTWSAGPGMPAPRHMATAVRLADGRVLIAGGRHGSSYLATADLYDPASNAIAATGSFADGRADAVSIVLDNGKVLMTGGFSVVGDLRAAYLYDPAAGTWSSTGNMNGERGGGTSLVKLADGKVLIAGGFHGTGELATAERYDPVAGIWTSTGAMAAAIAGHSMVRLHSGHVLALGHASTASQLYDPAADAWRISGWPKQDHDGVAGNGILLANGDVLFAPGGQRRISELYREALPTARTDFDGDGRSDVVFQSGARTQWLYFVNGSTVQSSVPLPAAAPGWVLAGIGDFDGNGAKDLLWRNTATATDYWIYLMAGTTVIGGGYVGVAADYRPTYVADFDGDGKADILWEKHPAGRWLNFMDGALVKASAPVPAAAPGWQIAGAGDFDGDGRSDLLWMSVANPLQYWVYLLDGPAKVGEAPLAQYGIQWYPPRWILDYDGDGRADLVWLDQTGVHDGALQVTHMNGLATTGSSFWGIGYPGWSIVGVGNFDNTGGLDLLWQNTAQPHLYTIYLHDGVKEAFGVAPGYAPTSR